MIATKQTKSGVVADVCVAVFSTDGDVYTGECVGTDSNAIYPEPVIATMIGDNQTCMVHTVVAVWKDEDSAGYFIPPCGHCRQFTQTCTPTTPPYPGHLSHDVVVWLSALLPYYDWWAKQTDLTSV
jgi:cytidine deaminase